MLIEFHVAVLLGQDSCAWWKCRKGILNQLRFSNLLAAKSKPGHNSMKLRIEGDEVGEVQHP